MKLTKKDLADVKFRARGKWYDARQVDAFLDRLAVAVEERNRELLEVSSRARALAAQVDALRTENEKLRAQKPRETPAAVPQPNSPEEFARLLEDIKALRAFRERFREAVEQDVAAFGKQVSRFSSEELLK